MRFVVATIAGALLVLSACPVGFAQEKAVPKGTAAPKPQVQAPAQQPQVVMPEAEKIVLLLRGTLGTLNDAIQTGNFTVLRDKGALGFREAQPRGFRSPSPTLPRRASTFP